MKRKLAAALACALCLTLSACGSGGTAVYVQSVERLAAMGGIAPGNRFLGLVVSEHTAEISRDSDKTIQELLVKEGDDVKEGQALFSYDTEELQLNLDKKNLEVQQLKSTIETCKEKIATLEKERSGQSGTAKLQYTVEIQSAQVDQKEAELKLKTKQSEVQKSEHLLSNAVVKSPVDGRVTAISEEGTDEYGKPKAYITIQQSGAFRVKGRLNEMSMGSLNIGSQVTMHSRLDDSSWTGTVVSIDADDGSDNNNNVNYGNYDAMTSSSSYVFYVELDSTDGLLLGQHVYMEVTGGEMPMEGLFIPESFLTDVVNDEQTWEMSATVFAANDAGKLEKRTVKLGMYDGMTGCYEITEGIDGDTWLADPTNPACAEGAAVTYRDASDFSRTGE